jgi:preprotein translocase subunit YajC
MMPEFIKDSKLKHCEISGAIYEGLTITTPDGKKGRLAVIDENGVVIEAGPAVAVEAWKVSIECYRNLLKDKGHLKIHSKPPGILNA